MTLDERVLAEAVAAHARLLAAERDLERARADFHHEVRRLHAAGGSLREIGERFGISHQRVHQVVDFAETTRGRGKGALLLERIKDRVRDWSGFTRFTAEARAVVVRAEAEAVELGHGRVGTEHLVLGILAAPRAEPGAQVLRRLGVERERVRDEVVRRIGTGDEPRRSGSLPLTPRTKKALERALREAVDRGDHHVGTEHVLLGAVADPSGVAARVLRDLGAEPARVRAEVERLT